MAFSHSQVAFHSQRQEQYDELQMPALSVPHTGGQLY